MTSEVETVTKSICVSSTTLACYGCGLDRSSRQGEQAEPGQPGGLIMPPMQTTVTMTSATTAHESVPTKGVGRTEGHRPGSNGHFGRLFGDMFRLDHASKRSPEDHVLPTRHRTVTRSTQHTTALPVETGATSMDLAKRDYDDSDLVDAPGLVGRVWTVVESAIDRARTVLGAHAHVHASDLIYKQDGHLPDISTVAARRSERHDEQALAKDQRPTIEQDKTDTPANMPLSPTSLPPNFVVLDRAQGDGNGKPLVSMLHDNISSSGGGGKASVLVTAASKAALCAAAMACIAVVAVF